MFGCGYLIRIKMENERQEELVAIAEDAPMIENDNHPSRLEARKYLGMHPRLAKKDQSEWNIQDIVTYCDYMRSKGHSRDIAQSAMTIELNPEEARACLRNYQAGKARE